MRVSNEIKFLEIYEKNRKKIKRCLKKFLKKRNIKNISNLKIGSFKEWDLLSHFNLLLQIEKISKLDLMLTISPH